MVLHVFAGSNLQKHFLEIWTGDQGWDLVLGERTVLGVLFIFDLLFCLGSALYYWLGLILFFHIRSEAFSLHSARETVGHEDSQRRQCMGIN